MGKEREKWKILRKNGGKIMEGEQKTIYTSLRLTEVTNCYIKEKAQEIGISQNAFTA